MQNFTYCNPTKLIFGKDILKDIGKETAVYGKKALLLYGKESLKKFGTYDIIVNSLKQNGIEIVEHPGVKPNPTLSHTREGIKKVKENDLQVIVACGGGSVIDEAKGIAIGSKYDGDVWDFYTNKAYISESVPIIAVETIPATTSHYNCGGVITNDETLDKVGYGNESLYPKVSFVCPELTLTLSLEQTSPTIADIMAHLIEVYFSNQEDFSPVQDACIEGLVKNVMKCGKMIFENPKDYQARESLFLIETFAWSGMSKVGLAFAGLPCHTFEHPISAVYDIPHGAGLSLITPHWMKYFRQRYSKKFISFAENVFNITNGSDEEKIDKAIEELTNFYKSIKSPVNFKEAGIDNPDINKLTDLAYYLHELHKLKEYEKEDFKKIYEMANE